MGGLTTLWLSELSPTTVWAMERPWRTLIVFAALWGLIIHAAIRRKPLCYRDFIGGIARDWENFSIVGRTVVRLFLAGLALFTLLLLHDAIVDVMRSGF